MSDKYEIDALDRSILGILQQDARTPYLDIARKLIVSGGTIHQRIEKMKVNGIICGSEIKIDASQLGIDITALLGVHLNSSKNITHLIDKLKKYPEILEVYYTTGNFGLIMKVSTTNIRAFHLFLTEKLQTLEEIRSTESFICLDTPLARQVDVSGN